MTRPISNDAEFDELQQLTLEAKDRLISGEGRSGAHYELMALLGKFGYNAMGREEAVQIGQRLCDEYLAAEANKVASRITGKVKRNRKRKLR